MAIQLFTISRFPREPGGAVGYLVDSTAPLNVDDKEERQPAPSGLDSTGSWEKGLEEIVDHLRQGDDPQLVVSIHGYNTPRDRATEAHCRSMEVHERTSPPPGCVFLACRWPSSGLLQPWPSSWWALPRLAKVALAGGLFLWLLGFGTRWLFSLGGWVAAPAGVLLFLASTVGGALALVVAVLILLRILVYFRDLYRATHYGVPDLVELLRNLDRVAARAGVRSVRLSFIGHSMGAFVVTNVVRILTDVFSEDSGGAFHEGRDGRAPGTSVGKILKLGRLILVSPDIPAEALMMRRANFLAASLKRFEESYLFTNEGDIVLHLVSTTANYFSFPTREARSGHRLGNVKVAGQHGLLDPKGHDELKELLASLRLGGQSLDELAGHVAQSVYEAQSALPLLFSFVDCTDYRWPDKELRLSDGRGGRDLTALDRTILLFRYFAGWFGTRRDVHSGYFHKEGDPPTPLSVHEIILRLASQGLEGFLACFEGSGPEERLGRLSAYATKHGLRVMLSPVVLARLRREKARQYAY